LTLMLLLQSRGKMTAQDLAAELEVSERTVYRDVDALSFAGVPIFCQSGVNGGIFLDENYRVSLTGFSLKEVRSLFITSGAGPLRDLGLGRASSDTLLKLLAGLPEVHRGEAERMRQRFYIDPEGWFHTLDPVPFLSVLQQAVWDDRVVHFRYQRPDGTLTERSLQAYALVAKSNIWYLVGRQMDGEMRTFRISRLRHVEISAEQFSRTPEFDIVPFWTEACRMFEDDRRSDEPSCEALVRVHPQAVRSFAGNDVGTFERLEQPDPQGWVRMRVTFFSFHSACTKVASLGTNVEVLEPLELRQAVYETARQVVELYAQGEELALAGRVR
ncbi:MAG: WYL domain-containing protein, partial [Anaerolineaceae bacterium]|nr:WYL domain-containing protein [Anaerolineaceae bacterium]